MLQRYKKFVINFLLLIIFITVRKKNAHFLCEFVGQPIKVSKLACQAKISENIEAKIDLADSNYYFVSLIRYDVPAMLTSGKATRV